jgi:predicted MFS family arabinose efflux permease
MAMAPLYGFALSRIPAEHAGSGAGVLSTVLQIGNGSGAAVTGVVYFTVQSHYADRLAFLASLSILATAVAVTTGLLCLLREPRSVASPATITGGARRV